MTNPETRSARAAITLGLLGVSVLVVGGALISVYASGDHAFPAGADTPWYVWRAKLVAGEGLASLPGSVQFPVSAKASRAGYPVLAGFLDTITGVAPFRLAFGLPAIMGILVGLGAGAFAIRGLREPRWAFLVYSIGVGTSVNVVLIAVSHADNLIVLAVVASAAATALLAAGGDRGGTATAALLAGAAVVHWPFAVLFGAILLGVAVLSVPESVAARRRGSPILQTPTGRLAAVVGGSAVAGAAALALTPAAANLPSNFERRMAEKLARDAPEFLGLGIPAAGGVVALAVRSDHARRRGLLLALTWALSALAGVLALAFITVPAHRILFFALGIPILAFAAITAVVRLLAGIRPAALGRSAAGLVGVALVAGGTIVALGSWRSGPVERTPISVQARMAGQYLTAVGSHGPVVFVVSRRTFHSPRNVIRASLPPNHIARAHVYIGDVDQLLAGAPTVVPGNDRYNERSLVHFEAVRGVLEERPIIVALAALSRPGEGVERGLEIGPGVEVIRGPTPQEPIPPASPPSPATTPELAGIVLRSLALFGAVGLGWAVSLLPRGWLTRLSVAPALGLSMLAVGGVVAARVGAGAPGARPWIAVALALAGWGPAAWRRWRTAPTRSGT